MNYKVEIKNVESQRVAYMKYKGDVTQAKRVFSNVFKSIRGKNNGAPFFNYLEMDYKTKTGTLELCVPTCEMPIGNGIEIKVFPYSKVLCVTHIGPYESMENAYRALDRYAKENQLDLSLPFREVFIKGPGLILKGNSNKYITEIQYVIKGDL